MSVHRPLNLAPGLDALARWRGSLGQRLAGLQRLGGEHAVLDDTDAALLASLRERLAGDRLVLAFVAEFSRGKSELINAIFLADAGRRVLPAAPGRTTMCPVELRWDADQSARLSLLPIETRLQGLSLAEWRLRDDAWQHRELPRDDPQALVEALSAVTQTRQVGVDEARALGLWQDTGDGPGGPGPRNDDNPPLDAQGRVEVPAWRHALIHYPHPLLQRGLVVLDTPGLNAVGAEPELTLGLLPSAHAVVFVLAADTGVTRSDLALWREHLGSGLQPFVALNKVDTLADPLAPAEEAAQRLAAQVQRQCVHCAQLLQVAPQRVFALSARNALAARVAGDDAALAASGVPALEAALAAQLLPQRAALLVQAVAEGLQRLGEGSARRLADRRRQQAEELLELRSLRGRSAGKLRLLLARVDAEAADFERCTTRLAALRAVQRRLMQGLNERLSSATLRSGLAGMQAAMSTAVLHLAARPAFDALLQGLHATLQAAQADLDEMQQMLAAGYAQLNAEHGFSLSLPPMPDLHGLRAELDLIAQSYGPHLSLTQGWRMALPGPAEQFRRMLLSRLRVVFERASGELQAWHQAASSQVDLQLRERRLAFVRRRETLQRVQQANGELEQRILEVQAQDDHLQQLQARWQAELDAVLSLALSGADPGAVAPVETAPEACRNAA
jgi:hypothetical protein